MKNSDDQLLQRLRETMSKQGAVWEEKRMFGGQCFMVDDKMCFGTHKGGVMARVGIEQVQQLVNKTGHEAMIHNGRPMKDYLIVQPEGIDLADDLEELILCCLSFNPIAKSSKRKKK